ncbi:MAG: DNA repair protein RecO [Planctomycetaceae bacterium]
MSAEKTEALVIRVADFSESSRVVSFFTRDFGRTSALAKGGRRLKGPFEAALDLLAACRIVFLRKSSGLDLLTEAQLISRFRPSGKSLVGLYGGYYVAELLSGLTEEYDPHAALYDAAQSTLHRLAKEEEPKLAILRFELAVLREIGQLPALDACLVCGRSPEKGGTFAHWVSHGGLICRECSRDEYDSQRIAAGTVAALRRFSSEDESLADRMTVSAGQLEEMRRFTLAAISHVLGRRPKMHRYLK